MNLPEASLVDSLVEKSLENIANSRKDIERKCWMVIHEYCNGSMPSEYDIRGIDEDLYLAVLKRVKDQVGG